MSTSRFQVPFSLPVWLTLVVWVALKFAGGGPPADLRLLLLSAAIVAGGELLEVDLRGGRTTPVSTAAVFALFVILPPAEVLAAVIPAFLAGVALKGPRVGWGARFRSASRRLMAVGVALVFYQALLPVAHGFASAGRAEVVAATSVMVAAGAVKLLLDVAISSFFIGRTRRIPARPIFLGQLQNRLALHAAFISVAALIAVSFAVLRETAFLLFLMPLLAARRSFKRYASIHKTYEQTIRGLSKVPELAGYAPRGHSVRVASIAESVSRDLGLSDSETKDVEFAALLHDVGRFSMGDPQDLPESVAGTPSGRLLAKASGDLIAKTPYLEKVAGIVRHQDDSYSDTYDLPSDHVVTGSRIIKVANDYAELTQTGGPAFPPETAMARLRAEEGDEYDPAVIDSLQRVLSRGDF